MANPYLSSWIKYAVTGLNNLCRLGFVPQPNLQHVEVI
jgi:hypothetical protein